MPFEPVVLFFVISVAAGLLRSDFKLPPALYEALSIYLLLAIGLKGGVELARHTLASVLPQALAAVAIAAWGDCCAKRFSARACSCCWAGSSSAGSPARTAST